MSFISTKLARHPNARGLLLGGPETGDRLVSVRAGLSLSLQARTKFVRYDGLEKTACDGHPSVRDHQTLANIVLAAIGSAGGIGAYCTASDIAQCQSGCCYNAQCCEFFL